MGPGSLCAIAHWAGTTTWDTASRSRDANRPSFAGNIPPSLQRAQGMPGAWCARRRVCDGRKQKAHALVRSHRKHPAFPAQWFYGLFRALPGDRAFLSPSLRESGVSDPKGRHRLPRNLTPASRRQDHTTSPSAFAPFVKGASTSTASRLTLVTIAKRPSGRWDGANYDLIWS
jgi:hypothetical protein